MYTDLPFSFLLPSFPFEEFVDRDGQVDLEKAFQEFDSNHR